MKECNLCNVEKELNEFHKNGKGYRGSCKKCVLEKHHPKIPKEKWKQNSGIFIKGQEPKSPFLKGHIPWNKGLIKDKPKSRSSKKYRLWREEVLKRDEYKCKKCDNLKGFALHAHHIVPWKKDVNLRYDIENGMTLCNSCHSKEVNHFEGFTEQTQFKKGHIPYKFWLKKNLSEDVKRKISESKKGKASWNKGIAMSKESKIKLSESQKLRLKNLREINGDK